mgnify:CR=1 FL=1
MVGTVDQMVTCSSWMSANAASGVKRPSIITSFSPPSRPTTKVEWQPDTWNNGEVKSAVGGAAGADGVGSPNRSGTQPVAGK